MNKRKHNRRPRRQIRAKDILVILLIAAFLLAVPRLMMGLINPLEPGEFGTYSGPILPLSSLSGGGETEVSRHVTLDFSIYGEAKEFYYAPERVRVTDSYSLRNPTDEPVSMELVWGFDMQFSGKSPQITVNGEPVAGIVRAGSAVEDTTSPKIQNFRMYSQMLTESDRLAEAMAEAPGGETPVKVYHFSNVRYEGEGTPPPMLGISWKDEKDTTVWVRHYSISGADKGRCYLNFDMGEDVWLYVAGADLADLKVGGSSNYTVGNYTEEVTEGMTWDLETREATFRDCLLDAAQAYAEAAAPEEDMGPAMSLVTPQMLCDDAMRRITGSNAQQSGGFHSTDSYFYNLYHDRRMVYWVFPVEIPAGSDVTVSAVYEKQSSYNADGVRHGYDIATTLGSNLNFVEQKATLVNTDPVILVELVGGQNFGFDPEAGITTVTMDTGVERYYLDLLLKDDEG